ncbi:aromatic-ring-hydroxylating dioxygenase subunit beta [Microbacterium sp. A196]|uniref:aromatic-ring-hydroxylating dioxygenase subunit beta n=1 Tax=Microbacterium sp. A196 TaxID=3457320 RepID=UPI003FD0EA72
MYGIEDTSAEAVDAKTYATVANFLSLEARLLDEGREEDWFLLLDAEYRYTIPMRQSTEPRSKEITRTMWRVNDTLAHIRSRIDRTNTGHAYSEVPPSRTLRVVGSIEVVATEDPTIVKAHSALLLYRQRGIDVHFDLIPARRNDLVRLTDEGPRLLSREAIPTETTLKTANLAVFL